MDVRALALAVVTLAAGCTSPSASVSFSTGPQTFMVRSADFALPEELRDGMSVRAQACGPMGFCPSADRVEVVCEGGTCDPAPTEVELPVGGVIDFDDLSSDLESLFTEVTSIRVTSATYQVQANTLTVGVGTVDLYWGPEGATGVSSAGVALLGTMPSLPAGATGSGEIAISEAGSEALSSYLVGTARRVRFFAVTEVDLEPGGPFPAGDLTGAVDMTVRAEGKVID